MIRKLKIDSIVLCLTVLCSLIIGFTNSFPDVQKLGMDSTSILSVPETVQTIDIVSPASNHTLTKAHYRFQSIQKFVKSAETKIIHNNQLHETFLLHKKITILFDNKFVLLLLFLQTLL